ncbi:MAG: ribosomal protein S18-alanine N-acetyltransferase [Clostridia bacterium]|nr:ribosomal protein S18-alanine N-acetyltransferase [Clostridia bacterium]
MKKIVIEEMKLDDIDDVVEVEKDCFSVPWSRESFVREITKNHLAIYLVAKVEEKAVGYIGVWKVMNEGHITNVAVHSAFRRQGIAQRLISELLSLCEKQEIDSFTLEVRETNEAAKALYRKFGFQESGKRKGYYQDNGEDAVIMWKYL